jgi:hypothetical protein
MPPPPVPKPIVAGLVDEFIDPEALDEVFLSPNPAQSPMPPPTTRRPHSTSPHNGIHLPESRTYPITTDEFAGWAPRSSKELDDVRRKVDPDFQNEGWADVYYDGEGRLVPSAADGIPNEAREAGGDRSTTHRALLVLARKVPAVK